jgi:hypothetical protein
MKSSGGILCCGQGGRRCEKIMNLLHPCAGQDRDWPIEISCDNAMPEVVEPMLSPRHYRAPTRKSGIPDFGASKNYRSRKHPTLVAIHHAISDIEKMDARVPQASVRSLRKLGCFARA